MYFSLHLEKNKKGLPAVSAIGYLSCSVLRSQFSTFTDKLFLFSTKFPIAEARIFKKLTSNKVWNISVLLSFLKYNKSQNTPVKSNICSIQQNNILTFNGSSKVSF
uniref:Uncharacterized protein n=1 Tax=Cacopsylla melanoneura TaxID=428564 RepID=A0A8D8ZYC4_9HEMI